MQVGARCSIVVGVGHVCKNRGRVQGEGVTPVSSNLSIGREEWRAGVSVPSKELLARSNYCALFTAIFLRETTPFVALYVMY